MSGEWKGWKNWDAYLKAGIVEDSVDFSDEPIIIDHAVGRTKKAIGKCWPMDAAVAYTLMKAGPDKPLKWGDMVNVYTRMAAVMMTRKVAYGKMPKPNTKSCGHDEVFAINKYLLKPDISFTPLGASKKVSATIKWQTGWNAKAFDTWLTMVRSEDGYSALLKEGYPEITDEIISLTTLRLKQGRNMEISSRTFLTEKYLTPLREWVISYIKYMANVTHPECELTNVYMPHSPNIVKSSSNTKGVCKWADDPEKECAHHDDIKVHMWGMVRSEDGFRTLYNREQCYKGWNQNQVQDMNIGDVPHSKVVSWEEVRRSMADAIPEHEVVMHIRESLARMLKRNDNIVSKSGRGKNSLHRWSDWGWLAEMSAYVKNTSSKNRKAGDIVNGWKYSKINSRHSYGHEIAEFVWKPVDELKDYIVGRKEPNVSSWQSAQGIMTNYRFATKQQVIEFMEKLHELHEDVGGFYAYREHDGIEKTEKGEWSVRSMPVTLSMYGRVDPEDYLSPQEILVLFRNASEAVLEEHLPNFYTKPSYGIRTAPKPQTQPTDNV
tara:strand:- start:530 stop:2173 length:1644 start_codon:yes stop_codon:yes gene_type:complete